MRFPGRDKVKWKNRERSNGSYDKLFAHKTCQHLKKEKKVAGFCIAQFETRQDAANFFNYYQEHTLCESLSPLSIKAAKFKGGPSATYSYKSEQTSFAVVHGCSCVSKNTTTMTHSCENGTDNVKRE